MVGSLAENARHSATMALSIPGSGHDLHLEQAGILHSVVSQFLDGLI
ncbi:hypothetical protein [Streptomyces sp. NPDC055058]